MKKISLAALAVFVLIFALMSTVQAQTPQETLKQYISELQKSPGDDTLREKIIKLAMEIQPLLQVPAEARKYMTRGIAAMEGARTQNDFREAAAEFSKALSVSPWLGNGYRNLAIAQDKAGMYDDALKNLRFYEVSKPLPVDAEWAEDMKNKIEYHQEKANKESSPAAITEKKRQTEEDFIQKLNGVRFVRDWSTRYSVGYSTLDIRGRNILEGTVCSKGCEGSLASGAWEQANEATLNGREFNTRGNCMSGGNVVRRVFNGKISEDGSSVTFEDCTGTITYRRER